MITKQGSNEGVGAWGGRTGGVCGGAGGRRNSLHPLQAKCDILKTSWKDQMRNGTILQRLDHVLQ